MCQNWFTIVRGWVMCQIGVMCQNWFTIVRGWVHVSKLVHDCSWLVHVSKLVHDCSWLVHVKIGSRLFVVQKHSSGDFNTKTLKKMRLVPFYVYIYTVCRRACRLYTR
jgi:hypothetical protein